MSETQLMALYAIAAAYGTGSVLTLGWYLFRGISYRLALGEIGWKPPLQWHNWLGIALDTVFIVIAWLFAARRLIRDERARRRPVALT